jgi:hypothetical protein
MTVRWWLINTGVDIYHTEGRILSAYTDHEHIKWHFRCPYIALDLAVIVDVHNLLLVINLGGLGLEELHRSLLVSQKVADWFHDTPVLDGAGCA